MWTSRRQDYYHQQNITHKSQDPGHTERYLAFEWRQMIMDFIVIIKPIS